MAELTLHLTLRERRELKGAVRQDCEKVRNAIAKLIPVRRARNASPMASTIGTQLGRIWRMNDNDDRYGAVTLDWEEDLLKVAPNAASVFARARARDQKRPITQAIPIDWPHHVSSQLVDAVVGLHNSHELQKEVVRVITHRDYPRFMSIGGELVRNPVWDQIPARQRSQVRKNYDVGGLTPPKVMRLDVLLVRRNGEHGRGEIYTYWSKDWNTYLLLFREWLRGENLDSRDLANADELTRRWSLAAKSITVTPCQGKFAVSAKLHRKRGDLILYIFEFCSVQIRAKAVRKTLTILRDATKSKSDRWRGQWRDLQTMISDRESWRVNADVIYALKVLFSERLRLPNSFPNEE